jgi:hypothetical protein
MVLDSYIQRVQNDLRAAAAVGSPDLQQSVDRLAVALESSVRLAMVDALGAACDELSAELAPGSVQVSITGGEPRLIASLPEASSDVPDPSPAADTTDDDGEQTRITLRISAALKRRVERAADDDGVSANTWIARSIATTLELPSPRAHHSSRHVRGWAH